MKTRITELLGIEYPVVQGAMARIADGGLAGAVSEAGGLGIIACGGARPEWIREQVARAINADPSEIVFTGCGTESDNTVLFGVAERYAKKGDHIITTNVEHHAILHTCEYLEKQGYSVVLPLSFSTA